MYAGGLEIQISADTLKLAQDIEMAKRMLGVGTQAMAAALVNIQKAMDAVGVRSTAAFAQVVEKSTAAAAAMAKATGKTDDYAGSLGEVGAMAKAVGDDMTEMVKKSDAISQAMAVTGNVSKSAFENIAFAAKAAGQTIGDSINEMTEKSKASAIAVSIALGAIATALGAGAIYAAYKVIKESIGLITGLFTGAAYENQFVKELQATNDAALALQETLQTTAYQAQITGEALKVAGLSSSEYAGALASVNSAATKNEYAFDHLGISIKDANGNLLSNEVILQNAAKALGEYSAGYERHTAAAALGIDSEKKIADAAKINAEALKGAQDNLLAYGLVITAAQQKSIAEFEQTTREFNHNTELTMQGFRKVFADALLPALNDLADWLKEGWPKSVQIFRGVTATFVSLLYGIKETVELIYQPIKAVFQNIGSLIVAMGEAASKALVGDFVGAKAVITDYMTTFKSQWSEAGQNIVAGAERNQAAIAGMYQPLMQVGDEATNVGKKFGGVPPTVDSLRAAYDKLVGSAQTATEIQNRYSKALDASREAFGKLYGAEVANGASQADMVEMAQRQIQYEKALAKQRDDALDKLNATVVVIDKVQQAYDRLSRTLNNDYLKALREATPAYQALTKTEQKFVELVHDQNGEWDMLTPKMQAVLRVTVQLQAVTERGIEAEKYHNELLAQQAALRLEALTGVEKYEEQQLEASMAAIKSANTAADAAELEVRGFGLLKSQLAEITLQRLKDKQVAEEVGTAAYGAIQQQIDAQERLIGALRGYEVLDANAKAAKETAEEWKRATDKIEGTFHDGFVNMLSGGGNAWKSFTKSLVNTFKTTVADAIYKFFAQPFVFSAIASVAGAVGLSGAAQYAGGAGLGIGGFASMASTAKNLYGAWNSGVDSLQASNLFGSFAKSSYGESLGLSVAPQVEGSSARTLTDLGQSAQTFTQSATTFASWATVAVDAFNSFKTGEGWGKTVGAAIGTYILPGIGTIIGSFIGGFADKFFAGGGPKAGGSASSNLDSAGLITSGARDPFWAIGPNSNDKLAQSAANVTAQGYYQTLIGLGGKTSGLSFQSGFDVDPAGEADNRVTGVVTNSDGAAIYSQQRDIGRDDKQIGVEMGLESQRQILAGLQASDLPKEIAQILKDGAPDVAAATQAQIQAAIGDAQFWNQTFINGAGKAAMFFGETVTLEAFRGVQTSGESLIQTFARIAPVFDATNLVAQTLGRDINAAFGAVGLASQAARTELVNFAGGADALKAAVSSYATNFLSEEERRTQSTKVLTAQFESLGEKMPVTRDGFKALIEAQDLTTEAGRKHYAGLIVLADAYAQVVPAQDAAIQGLVEKAGLGGDTIANAFSAAMSNSASPQEAGAAFADTVVNSMIGAMQNNLAQQVQQIVLSGIVKPILTAMAGGATLAEAVGKASFAATVTAAKEAIQNMADLFNSPEWKDLLAQIKASLGSIGADAFGKMPTITPLSTTTSTTTPDTKAADDLKAATADYAGVLKGLNRTFADLTAPNDYQRSVNAISASYADASDRLKDLAAKGVDTTEASAQLEQNTAMQRAEARAKQQQTIEGYAIKLLQEQGFAVEALNAQREMELANITKTAGAEAANIQRQINAAQDANKTRSLEIGLMEAQGDAGGALAARRALELQALSATDKAIQRQIYAQQDLAQAISTANGAVTALRNLMTAQGKTGELAQFDQQTGKFNYQTALNKLGSTFGLSAGGVEDWLKATGQTLEQAGRSYWSVMSDAQRQAVTAAIQAKADYVNVVKSQFDEAVAAGKEIFRQWQSAGSFIAKLDDDIAKINIDSGKLKAGDYLAQQITTAQTALAGATDPDDILAKMETLRGLQNQRYSDEKTAMDGLKASAQSLKDFAQQLADYSRNLMTGDLSPLNASRKASQAQANFLADVAAAQGGDAGARGRVTSSADTYLKLAQSQSTSSLDYSRKVAEVQGKLAGLGAEALTEAQKSADDLNSIASSASMTVAALEDLKRQAGTLQDGLADKFTKAMLDVRTIGGVLARLDAGGAIEKAIRDLPGDLIKPVGKIDSTRPASVTGLGGVTANSIAAGLSTTSSDADIKTALRAASQAGIGALALSEAWNTANPNNTFSAIHIADYARDNGIQLMAEGGITNGLSIAGEAGPEAVIPLRGGAVPVSIDFRRYQSSANDALLAELRAAREETAAMRQELAAIKENTRRSAVSNDNTSEVLRRVTRGGETVFTETES